MMGRKTIVLTVLCLGVATQGVQADWADFWHRVHVDFHRNNCWPQPFQEQDRELIRNPLIAMTAAGWRQNNTLSDHFFGVDDHSVNQAGDIKIRWIVTQAPPHRRTVFVLRGPTPHSTAARLAAVQQKVDRFALPGERPAVVVTDIIPPGASGDYFDQVDRQFKQSIPPPRLPALETGLGGNN